MSRISRLLSMFVLVSLLASCIPGGGVSQKTVKSKKPRAEAGQAAQGDFRALAAGNNAFALELYQRLNASEKQFFYSPYSISLALAMAYAGAREDTAQQMAEALHFELPAERLHPDFNRLDQELASRKESGGKGADGKGFRLNIVNDIWGQEGYAFQADYLDLLAVNYGSGLRQLDFQGNPEAARKTINDYIAQKTEKRIRDLIPEGAIDPLTRMVLTNAIYFNAAWMYPFDKAQTKPAPFTQLDGSKSDVAMMRMEDYEMLNYVDGDGYQAVALPYENGSLSMLLLVPDEGKFSEFEANMDGAKLDEIVGGMKTESARVSMPGFELESMFGLNKTLSDMGMVDAFDRDKANFSGLDGTRDLYISDVIHKSFVKVDEAGTEAAAATAVIFRAVMAPIGMVDLVIDRPFIFLIRDEPSNTILFVGKMVNPQHAP